MNRNKRKKKCVDCPYVEPVFHCKKEWTAEDYMKIKEEQDEIEKEILKGREAK